MHVAPIEILFGAGSVGQGPLAFATDVDVTRAVLALCKENNITSVDTAMGYAPGFPRTSETLLGEAGVSNGFKIDTKADPSSHSDENIKKSLAGSLALLKIDKVRIFWLHGPNPSVPTEETLRAVDYCYRSHAFEAFGLSNHSPEEIEEYIRIADQKGWIRPTALQDCYSALYRQPEAENNLFDVARKYNMKIYAFSPTAGGIFAGKWKSPDEIPPGRFEGDHRIAKLYRKLFLRQSVFDALQSLQRTLEQFDLNGIDVALRWIAFHSRLRGDFGDGVIIGASKLEHISQNATSLRRGPLPKEVVMKMDEMWESVKDDAPEDPAY
ncbi:Aldo/keto reductase [Atractiella rhizophila]|nr:Aldo/keto reductase [Atractiella rhizophila]